MRLPLAILIAPPLVLAGAIAVFAGLHAWQGTPRTSRSALPVAPEVRTVKPRFGLQVENGVPNVAEASGTRIDAERIDRSVELTVTGLPLAEDPASGLCVSLVDPKRGTIVATSPLETAADGTGRLARAFEGTPNRDLHLAIHGTDDSARYQYRDRVEWPADQLELKVERVLKQATVEIVGGPTEKDLLLSARRTDDPDWSLPLSRARITRSGTADDPVTIELPPLGPAEIELVIDGSPVGKIDLRSEDRVRVLQN